MLFPIFAYILAIAAAELAGVLFSAPISLSIHILLVVILLGHYIGWETVPYRRVLPILMLLPILRILSFIMPIQMVPQIYWYGLVGVPLLVTSGLIMRFLSLPGESLGLGLPPIRTQALIALSGLPLGAIAFLILRPEPLGDGLNLLGILVRSVILTIFSGFTEELIFRGLLRQGFSEAYGNRRALLLSSLLFPIMYIGSLSIPFIIFIALVGLFFGYCANRTGSIWGIGLAHSIMNIGLIIVFPLALSFIA